MAAPKAKYHGPSQDSQRRLVPGAGGDSAKSRPPGSCFPALQKLSEEDDPSRGCVPVDMVLRESCLRRDLERRPAEDMVVCWRARGG